VSVLFNLADWMRLQLPLAERTRCRPTTLYACAGVTCMILHDHPRITRKGSLPRHVVVDNRTGSIRVCTTDKCITLCVAFCVAYVVWPGYVLGA
jgi:hypothetical protein